MIYDFLNLLIQFSILQIRGGYISLISFRINNDLGKAVEELKHKIETYIKIMINAMEHPVKIDDYGVIFEVIFKGNKEIRNTLSDDAKIYLSIFDNRTELNEAAKSLVEKIITIKTQGIKR